MILPSDPKRKETKVKYVLDTCLDSQNERYQNYSYRRQYFLFGTADDVSSRVLYNKLQSHTDLVSSFLFSGDHAEFELSATGDVNDEIIGQLITASEDWNDEFRDSGLADMVSDSILWSLIFDSMFIKIGWNDARDNLTATLVPPYNFGVYDESEPDINSQQGFAHTFTIDYEEACQRLIRAGLRHRIDDLRASATDTKPTLPEPLSLMLANTQRQHITDPVVGKVIPNYARSFTYQSNVDVSRVRFSEVWVWDDESEDENGEPSGDYRRFLVMEPGIILEDSKETIYARRAAGLKGYRGRINPNLLRWTDTNDFIPGEHPFSHICLYPIYDYFWGECHTERIIPLQDWLTTRLNEIHEILDMQVDPPRVFAGFMGLLDEKADALHGPGTWVSDMNPSAKVERLTPEMPEDLFKEVSSMGELFLEASGLTRTTTGEGAPHIKSGKQAKQAATTGSGRIKKTAIRLEGQLVQLADVAMKLRQAKDKRVLKPESGNRFYLSQIPVSDWKIRISGHSHSPLFTDDARELADRLLHAESIDRLAYMHMLRPPGESNLRYALKRRMTQEHQFMQQHPEMVGQKGTKKGPSPVARAVR